MALKSFSDVEEALANRDRARAKQAEKFWEAIDDLRNRVGGLEARVQTLEDRPVSETDTDLTSIEGRVQALEDGAGPVLAAHLEHSDPHGDRAYADSLNANPSS